MVAKIMYWIPRVLAIIAIIFMLMFSLDMIGENIPLGRKILGLLVHNIPAFLLIVILVIAWKRELIGGIIFIVASLAACVFFRSFSGNPGSLVVVAPFFLTGLLFILNSMMFGKPSEKS
jgi:hypothetical protein